jgi:hypothetical protein
MSSTRIRLGDGPARTASVLLQEVRPAARVYVELTDARADHPVMKRAVRHAATASRARTDLSRGARIRQSRWRQTREDPPPPHPLRRPDIDGVAEGDCAARLTPDPGRAAYGLGLAASSSHSSAYERATRAASRARPAARRSRSSSSLRFACSYLSACASASAALCSSVMAVRRSTDASCAARTHVSPTARGRLEIITGAHGSRPA